MDDDATSTTRMYRDGTLVASGFPAEELSERLSEPGTVVWLDLVAPGHAELRMVAGELGLDPVAVEDAVSPKERAKLDRYRGYVFVNVYAPEITGTDLVMHEVSAFLTSRAMVTVRPDRGFAIEGLTKRWDDGPEASEAGGDACALLLYGLLDLVVDLQLDAAQSLDDEADALEELLFEPGFSVKEIQRRSFQLRKNLVALRRVSLPMRDIVSTLLRRPSPRVPETLIPYMQDVYDHALRIGEWTDALRDTIANLLDTRIALQSSRMNEVMKQVTSWAAIIAVPTAVTGFYGMNVAYPGFGTAHGFVASTAIVITASATLYLIFKIRGWL